MSTRLEHFPNELLLCLFTYFDISNLHDSFWGINQRFNNLLRSLHNLSLILEKDNSFLVEHFARQINRLKVNTSQPIDFSQFTNLYSLELCQANDNQIEQIRSYIMPDLINLTISTRSHISLPLELIQEIFSSGFHSLRHARLNRVDTFQVLSDSQSLSLHSLHITCTDANIIPQILLSCPNLFSFDVIFVGQDHHILPPASSSYDHSLEKFSLSDSYHKLSFDTIHSLFLYIPNVKYLCLELLCRVPFVNLIESMIDRLKQLNQFECDILEAPNNNMVSLEVIQQMNECFQYLQCDEQANGFRLFLNE